MIDPEIGKENATRTGQLQLRSLLVPHCKNKIEELSLSCTTDVRLVGLPCLNSPHLLSPLRASSSSHCPSLPGNNVCHHSRRASAYSQGAVSQSWMETWYHLCVCPHFIGEKNRRPKRIANLLRLPRQPAHLQARSQLFLRDLLKLDIWRLPWIWIYVFLILRSA